MKPGLGESNQVLNFDLGRYDRIILPAAQENLNLLNNFLFSSFGKLILSKSFEKPSINRQSILDYLFVHIASNVINNFQKSS